MRKLFFCCQANEEKKEEVFETTQQSKNFKKITESDYKGQFNFELENKSSEDSQQDYSLNKNNESCLIKEIEIKKYPHLVLKEIEGNILKGKKIIINPNGMKDGLRGKKDGVTKFGTIDKINNEIVNDFIVNLDVNKNVFQTLFEIIFDPISGKYKIICCENGYDENTVIFIKLDNRFLVKKKQILSLGDLHISIDVEPTSGMLTTEVVSQNEETRTLSFNTNTPAIRIGRNKKNEIFLNNPSYSRIHSTIVYDQNEESWYIQDGFEGKSSTNGTWLYLDHEWVVEESVAFRIGKSFFKITKSYP